MIKLHDDLPIYLIKNFYVPLFNKEKIIQKVIENQKKYSWLFTSINFPIIDDHFFFFRNLYTKYYKLCKRKFKFTKHINFNELCWVYVGDKYNYKEIWHHHQRTSTVSSVYYLNIPDDKVSIDFKMNQIAYTYYPKNYDLLIFPSYLEHKPNRCYKDGYRISINMELLCNEHPDKLFNQLRK